MAQALSPSRFIEVDNLGKALLRQRKGMKPRQFSSLVRNEVIPVYMAKRGVAFSTAKRDILRIIKVAEFGKGWNYIGITVIADTLSKHRFKPLYDYARELIGQADGAKELLRVGKEIKDILSLVRKGKDVKAMIKVSRTKFKVGSPFSWERTLNNILAAYPDLPKYLKENPKVDFMEGIWKAYERDPSRSLKWEDKVSDLSTWIDYLEDMGTVNARRLAKVLEDEQNSFFEELF